MIISIFQIAIGVMSAFAVIWAAMKTWSWSRRSGKLAVDPYTLGILLVNKWIVPAEIFHFSCPFKERKDLFVFSTYPFISGTSLWVVGSCFSSRCFLYISLLFYLLQTTNIFARPTPIRRRSSQDIETLCHW